jgi:hypothetical protein
MIYPWSTRLLRNAVVLVLPVTVALLLLRRSVSPFNVEKVLAEAIRITSRSREYGALAEDLL